jgi:hypothetical protein
MPEQQGASVAIAQSNATCPRGNQPETGPIHGSLQPAKNRSARSSQKFLTLVFALNDADASNQTHNSNGHQATFQNGQRRWVQTQARTTGTTGTSKPPKQS